MLNRLFILLIGIFISIQVNATAQYPDILLIEDDTFFIFTNPLEQYLENKGDRIISDTALIGNNTACWRGYMATWRLRNDSLFLISIVRNCGWDNAGSVELSKEFGSEEIFANWFSGNIKSPRGRLLQYVHGGYASIYEEEFFFEIVSGIIKSEDSKNYVTNEKGLIFPDERFIHDTIRRLVYLSLDTNETKEYEINEACQLEIQFNKDGKIDSISNSFTYDGVSMMEESILTKARNVLADFPALMKVTHEKYYPPIIEIYFDGKCVQKHLDIDYGCEYAK